MHTSVEEYHNNTADDKVLSTRFLWVNPLLISPAEQLVPVSGEFKCSEWAL